MLVFICVSVYIYSCIERESEGAEKRRKKRQRRNSEKKNVKPHIGGKNVGAPLQPIVLVFICPLCFACTHTRMPANQKKKQQQRISKKRENFYILTNTNKKKLFFPTFTSLFLFFFTHTFFCCRGVPQASNICFKYRLNSRQLQKFTRKEYIVFSIYFFK